MKPLTTTLRQIEKFHPCAPSWRQLLKGLGKTQADDKPLRVSRILKICGLWDAIWAANRVAGAKGRAYSNRVWRAIDHMDQSLRGWEKRRDRIAYEIFSGRKA